MTNPEDTNASALTGGTPPPPPPARGRQLAGGLLLIALIAVLPVLLPMSLAIDIVILAIAGVAFNLMLGYAGMLSFGQAAFFALGAYTAGYLLKHTGVSAVPAMMAGALMGAFGAAIVGVLTTRLRDVYFILMTLAFAQLCYFVALTWRDVTGGSSGLSGFDRPGLDLGVLTLGVASDTAFYVFASLVFMAVFGVFYAVVCSPVGLVLRAIRQNQDRLEAVGYPVGAYKLAVFVLSGAMTGIAGVLYAFQWQLVPTSVASMNQSATIVFMSILGGAGHPLGPVVGAGIYVWLSDVMSTFWGRWPLLFGVILIGILLFMRGGAVQGVALAASWIARKLSRN
jgi:branched-chain amino acid transport system permease protein